MTNLPNCAACQFAKQPVCPKPGTATSVVADCQGITKQKALHPGTPVFVDHFLCGVKSRLFSLRGKNSDDSMFCGGCVFQNAASGCIHVEFQINLTTHATLESKEKFEAMCRDQGVISLSYISDGGSAFASQEFTEHLNECQQAARVIASGAHHHNPAERAIWTNISIARAMMVHAAMHWPDMADPSLWPMAVAHSAYLHNHMPSLTTGLAPVDIFTRSLWEQKKLLKLHVWGCPACLLEKSLADCKKIPG